MVDVSRPQRGQLLVVTALALAVLLVLMALALNTAAFGGVHAAGSDEGLREERAALEYQAGVTRGVAGLLTGLDGEYDEYDALGAAVDDAVAGWNESTGRLYAGDGAATGARAGDHTFESVVVQDDERPFTDDSGAADWTLAADTSNVTGFEMNLSRDGLLETTGCAPVDGCFTLSVDGTWRLSAHRTGGILVVVVESSGGTDQCTTTDETAVVEVTNGTVGGDCSFPTFRSDPAVDAPYTLAYTNGDNATGTYRFTANGRLTAGTIAADDRYGTTGSPRIEPRVAATDVTVTYRSRTLEYRTDVRVRRGETDG